MMADIFDPDNFSYQSFEDQIGLDKSLEKLKSLKLPVLYNKSVLDIACNEGFFCNAVLTGGASSATGIDSSSHAINKAKSRFPNIVFLEQTWDFLPTQTYDIILFLSALHYICSPEGILNFFVSVRGVMKDDSVFILETGLSKNDIEENLEEINRPDGTTVFYPSYILLENLLHSIGLSPKLIGESSVTADDRVRYVIHIRKIMPIVVLNSGNANTGKSTVTNFLVDRNCVIDIDGWYNKLGSNFSSLKEIIKTGLRLPEELLYSKGISPEQVYSHLLDYVLKEINNRDQIHKIYILDGKNTFEANQYLAQNLSERGYKIWEINPYYLKREEVIKNTIYTDGIFLYNYYTDYLIGNILSISRDSNSLIIDFQISEIFNIKSLKKVFLTLQNTTETTIENLNFASYLDSFSRYESQLYLDNNGRYYSVFCNVPERNINKIISVAGLSTDFKVRFFDLSAFDII